MLLFFICSYIIKMVILVKRAIEIIYRLLLVLIIVLWIGLIVMEYNRYQKNLPMLVLLKEDKITYDDGYVIIDYGLGYKSITYERANIKGREFGHIFISVREKLLNK